MDQVIEITLESADLIGKDREICLKHTSPHRHDILNPTGEGLHAFYTTLHRYESVELVQEIWPRKLKPVVDCLLLDKLVVDLGDSCCTGRCCKMADYETRKAFSSGFAMGMPKVVQLRGADNAEDFKAYIEEETAKRQSMLGGVQQQNKGVSVAFNKPKNRGETRSCGHQRS